ncbi:GNAT family N-acetyltransferase [Rhodococcus spelaei]|uniref:GNAT family N-acetyltransferase n=1 Tax=Rhodococcus spelaei TaxID=2546320 RepID=A0A541BPD9_9NOCA|nr:GNAT family N-acetyltransferase [Rhodococcus spelaei]TQF74194.1 GNAT family N-acetyltransferase [Rhodococcus spelaei]
MFVRELSSQGLCLTPPTVDDVESITRCCRDEEIGEWTTLPKPYGLKDAERFVSTVVPSGWADRSPTWALRHTPRGPVVGMIGLGALDDSASELGFWLDPAVRGRGLMSAAVNLVCDFGFEPDGLALERIEWRAFVGNTDSAVVARRVGFRFEGTRRAGGLQRGRRRDEWVAGLLYADPREPAEDWPRID